MKLSEGAKLAVSSLTMGVLGGVFGVIATLLVVAPKDTGVHRVNRIELVNKDSNTTMVLDGEKRVLTILDAKGEIQCITLGPMFSGYSLGMRTRDTRKGGIVLIAGPGQGSIGIGTDGEDIMGFPGKPLPTDPNPFWRLVTNPSTGELEIEMVDPAGGTSTPVQKWSPPKAVKR